MELRSYFLIIRRRLWIVLLSTVLAVMGAAVYSLLFEARYADTATIVKNKSFSSVSTELSPSSQRPPGREEELSDLAALIQSEPVLDRVIKTARLSISKQQLASMITVQPIDRFSEVLAITVKGRDPQALPAIANTIAGEFANFYHELTIGTSKQKREFLENELDNSYVTLQAAEKALQEFKSQHKLISVDAEIAREVDTQANLRAQEQAAETEVAELRMLKGESQQALGKEPATAITGRVLSTSVISNSLRSQLVDLELKLANMRQTRTEKHPEVIQLEEEIAALKDKLQANAQEEVTSKTESANPIYSLLREKYVNASVELASAQAKLATLRKINAGQGDRVKQLTQGEAEQVRLQLDRDTAQETYTLLATKRNDALIEEREAVSDIPIQLVGSAGPAYSTVKLPLRLAVALVLGVMLGSFVVLGLHYFENTIYSIDDVEALLELPGLAALPAMPIQVTPANMAALPNALEPYEILRANILYSRQAAPFSLLAVVSATPGMGKSTVISNLAVTLARDGHEVIVVDADLRKPMQARLFNLENEKGLTTLLQDSVSLEDVIQQTEYPRLRVLTSGSLPDNPPGLLFSEKMRVLAKELAASAELVLIDTPALDSFADTLLILPIVESVVVITAAGASQTDVEIALRDQLARMNIRVIGTVINKIREEDDRRSNYYHYYH
jgi:polysaccharide biosynthesis transport protein